MRFPLQLKLSLTALAAVTLAGSAALRFASLHPGLWSITVAGVLCASTAILAGWIIFRFDGDASHKEALSSIQPTAKPPAAIGLDQVIDVLGVKLSEDLSRLGEEVLKDYR